MVEISGSYRIRIRNSVKVVEVPKKAQEIRLQWYGHSQRKNARCRGKTQSGRGEKERKTKEEMAKLY